jgi:RNA polymerase sigma-70 factor (ECF subfamily)
MDETILIQELQTGDRRAFRELVELYQDKVYNTVHGLVQDQEDALDLTQEVFLEAFRSVAGFRGDSSISTWIYRIAVNKALNMLKKKRNRFFLFRDAKAKAHSDAGQREMVDTKQNPEQELQNKELGRILQKAIADLPDRQRTAFVLHKLEDLSYKEIADVLRTTVPSVESLIHRAKAGLQDALGKCWGE